MPCASCSSSRSNLRRSRRRAAKKTVVSPGSSASASCKVLSREKDGHSNEIQEEMEPSADLAGNIPIILSSASFGSDSSLTDASSSSEKIDPPYYLRGKSMLPAEGESFQLLGRKRVRKEDCANTTDIHESKSASEFSGYQLSSLPDDCLLAIFRFLNDKDLCRVSQVNKRFNALADDLELWRKLYQSLYEYDLPLFHPEPCRFEFEAVLDSEYSNPWKESYRQLFRGIHVRPGFESTMWNDRDMKFFNTIESALDYVYKNSEKLSLGHEDGPIVFIHSGTYTEEFIVIDCDISLIGAARGIVNQSVILDRCTESTLMFVEGAKHAYAGYMTLKYTPMNPPMLPPLPPVVGPPIGPGGPLMGPPIEQPIDEQMGPYGPPEPIELLVPVPHPAHPPNPPPPVPPPPPPPPFPPANPLMLAPVGPPMGPPNGLPINYSNKQCCLEISDNCSCVIDSCIIWSNSLGGAAVCVSGMGAKPTIRRCDISYCSNVGLCISDFAQGIYEDNEICNNFLAGMLVRNGANPIVRRNHIHHGRDVGILAIDNAIGYFENNDIHSNCNSAIEVKSNANPTVVNCDIHHGPKWGIYVHGSGRGQFMYNKIHTFNYSGVWITSTSNPTIRRNEIYNCRQGGVYVYEGRALIEYNNIYGDALPGIQITTSGHPIIRYNNIFQNY